MEHDAAAQTPREGAEDSFAWQAGCSRQDITAAEEPVSMLGWGVAGNIVRGVALPTHARALALKHRGSARIAVVVCAEVCFITQALRDAVVEGLSSDLSQAGVRVTLDPEAVMLTATHTHSAAGGHAHELFYNLTIPGFSPYVLATYAAGIRRAVVEAVKRLEPVRLTLTRGELPSGWPMGFIRSVAAYNRNPEVVAIDPQQSDAGIDRRVVQLCCEDARGRPLALINWFACHCTNVHGDNQLIHSDNKGVAAERVERDVRQSRGDDRFVAIFAAEASGDVSPNFRWSWRRLRKIGAYDSDFESAAYHGELQAQKATELLKSRAWSAHALAFDHAAPPPGGAHAAALQPLPQIDAVMRYVDFDGLELDPEFSDGRARRTGFGTLGLSFMEGTAEGPGPLYPTRPLARALSAALGRWRRQRAHRLGVPEHPQGSKFAFLETGRGGGGRILHKLSMGRPVVPGFIHATVRTVRDLAASGNLGILPWTPNIVPLQLLVIGPLAIVGLPCEPTTIAGRCLRRVVAAALRERGVHEVVINGYANAYALYLTTPHEYAAQTYEGGATLFGQWALGGYLTALAPMCSRLSDPVVRRGPAPASAQPVRFPAEELAARSFPEQRAANQPGARARDV